MNTINAVGPLLFGPSWQTPLAEALGLNIRTVQRWAAGEHEVLPRYWTTIAEMMRLRREELAMALETLEQDHPYPSRG